MAKYHKVEPYNQQTNPDEEDFPLTPRLERTVEGDCYSNLYDLRAKVEASEEESQTTFRVSTKLNNSSCQSLSDTCELIYRFSKESTQIQAKASDPTHFIFPILCTSEEQVAHSNPHRIEIKKDNKTVSLIANAPIEILLSKGSKVFNLVPGAQALPLRLKLP